MTWSVFVLEVCTKSPKEESCCWVNAFCSSLITAYIAPSYSYWPDNWR